MRYRIRFTYIATILVLGAVSSVLAGITYARFTHTLASSGKWYIGKNHAILSVHGGNAFEVSTIPLSTDALNLGAWFGYEQVTSPVPLQYDEIAFDFKLDPGSYVAFLFDGTESGYRFIRFSSRRDLPTIMGSVDADGKFTDTRQGTTPVTATIRHTVRLKQDGSSYTVWLDGKPVSSMQSSTGGPKLFGFKGSEIPAYVDDVVVRYRGTTVFSDRFNLMDRAALPIAVSASAYLAALMLTSAVAGWFGKRRVMVMFFSVTTATVCCIVAPAAAYYVRNYPDTPLPILTWNIRPPTEMGEYDPQMTDIDLQMQGSTADQFTILFFGASQTWGAGAMGDPPQTFPYLTGVALSHAYPAANIRVVNAGLSGTHSREVAKYAQQRWYPKFSPDVTVINLSSSNENDYEKPLTDYYSNIETIISSARAAGSLPVLMLEPNSPEHDQTRTQRYRDVVRQVGSTTGVAVLDANAYIASRNGEGFLWWDSVHMTQYGYRLIAEYLTAALPPITGLQPSGVSVSGTIPMR